MANIDFSKEADEKDVYPALHHFKVITDASVNCEENLKAVLSGHDVRIPPTRGKESAGGKYVSYDISVFVVTRAEHHAIHSGLKGVPGVKILI